MKTKTRERILTFIQENRSVRPNDLIEHFRITAAAIHRHLLRLQKEHFIEKVGSPPKVFYRALQYKALKSSSDEAAKPAPINEPLQSPPSRPAYYRKNDLDFLD